MARQITVILAVAFVASSLLAQGTRVAFKVSAGAGADQSVVRISANGGSTEIVEVALIAKKSDGAVQPLAYIHSRRVPTHQPLFSGRAMYSLATAAESLTGGSYEARLSFDSANLTELVCVMVRADGEVLTRTLVSSQSLQNTGVAFTVGPDLCTPYDVDCSHCNGGLITGSCCRGNTKICVDCPNCRSTCIGTNDSCPW